MANKRYSDVKPNRGDKDSRKDATQPSGRQAPKSDPTNFETPSHARGGAPSGKGGKDLPCPKFVEQKHTEPTGELPKNGK